MPSTTAEKAVADKGPTLRHGVEDTIRQAAHLSHEAKLLRSLAADAIDDRVHDARRAMKAVRRRVEELGDIRDEAIHRIRRNPLMSVGAAVGMGLLVGLATGWLTGRSVGLHKTSQTGDVR